MSSVLVGSAYGVLELRSQQFDQGVDASLAKLAQLRQAFSQGIPPLTLPPVGGNLPGPGTPRQLPGGLAPDIQKDEQAMLRYASSLASAQKAQGDLSGAANTYRTVLGQLTPNTIEANRAAAALASTETALAKETANATALAGSGSGLAGVLGGVTAAATVAVPALIALKGAADLAETGAQAERTATAFDTLATKAGTTGSALLSALRNASGREVSDLNLQLAATKAEFTGVATSAADFSRLMAIARNNSREFGISTADGFNRLIDALDRGQVRGLKQIGLNIDLKKAEADYAQSIGVTVASLDEEQKRQALVQATLALGEQQLKKTGGAADDAAAGQDRLGASWDNVKAKLGSFIADGVAPTVNSLSDLLNASDGSAEGVQTLALGAINLSRTLVGMPALTDAEAKAQRGWTQSIQDWIAAREVQLGLTNAPTGSSSGGTFEIAKGIEFANAYTTAASAAAQASQDAATKVQFFAQASDISARASAVDTAAKEAQQSKTALVAAQTNAAADAFLALNPTMGASAAYAAAIAQGLGVVTAQVIAFRIEANKTKDDLLGIQNAQRQTALDQLIGLRRTEGASSGRGGGSDAAADSAAFVGVLKTQNEEQQKLLDSEIALAGAKKETARQIELLRRKQSEYQKGTAEYNQIEAQIIGIQTQGGRARVSAAASTGLQLQSVEENTQAQLLKTQREGLERLRDQQQDFDLKRSRSKEDEDEKIRHLFETGQRAAAARERADFEKQQRRDQEDYNIARQRTIRNNQEASGDITGAADRRVGQIDARAALRGVRPGGASLGNGATPAIGGGGSTAAARGPAMIIGPFTIAPTSVQIDGKQFVEITWPLFEVKVDDELSASIHTVGTPNSTQAALAGTAP